MTCLNCCALPPESTKKLRCVSGPINTLLNRNATLRGSCYHKHPPLPPGHKLSCTIVLFVMTEYPSEWDQTTDLQRSKEHLSTYKDLLTAHLGTALCPFSCIRLSQALVSTTLWYCPALVLTLCWQRHKWELTLGMERGISHFTYPHREMCWGCANVSIRQSAAGAVMRTGGKRETNIR